MKKIVLAAAVVLAIAGGLLLWGGVYASHFVKDNLSDQNITFPSAEALTAQNRQDLLPYANAKVDTGDEAKAFASYIKGHLEKIGGGKTYSEISAEYQAMSTEQKATPEGQALEQQRMTMFMGESLRGMLLNAYGWGLVAKVALIAGAGLLAAAALGGVMYALSNVTSVPKVKSSRKKTTKKRK